ncbi:MAG: YdcF family protein [Alphaproteobacteria bacterium]|nr:YdcF family protein [Alphaproteobacteria bacterium]
MKAFGTDILPNLALWGLFLGAIIIWVRGGWTRGSLLLKISVLSLFILSVPVSSRLFTQLWARDGIEGGAVQAIPNMAVLVFGAGLGSDEHGHVWPSGNTLARGFAGMWLANSLAAPILITGGVTDGAGPSEAELIAEYLVFKGLKSPVFIEKNSLNTYENAINSYEIMKQNQWAGFYAVTDPLHSRRAVACLRAAGVPVVIFSLESKAVVIGIGDFLPTVGGLNRWRGLGYEITASLYYILVGRIGFADVFRS